MMLLDYVRLTPAENVIVTLPEGGTRVARFASKFSWVFDPTVAVVTDKSPVITPLLAPSTKRRMPKVIRLNKEGIGLLRRLFLFITF
jgi:hypothetical protein